MSVISIIRNAFPVSETLLSILYPVNFSKATCKSEARERERWWLIKYKTWMQGSR